MTDEIDTSLTLKNDVECILLECHRDRPGIFAASVTKELLGKLAERVAGQLGPIIGGRYVPNRYAIGKMIKDERDSAVWAAHDSGATNAQIIRRFVLSRRLVYSILAQKRKG